MTHDSNRFRLRLSAPALALVLAAARASGGTPVLVVRTPDDGIQPQAAVDARGALHVIYLKGDPAAADVFYVRREPGSERWTAPLRVNSRPGSAIATGTVRGPHVALGKGDRVHVAWMGSQSAEPRGPGGATPMLYARLDDAGAAFQPERNVMQFAVGLDGGASVAADRSGSVYVVWHAGAGARGEAARRVWVARSDDEGKSFAREVSVGGEATGVCGCCGMRAFADPAGRLFLLYRAATEEVHRDMILMSGGSGAGAFRTTRVAEWNLRACPMSTAWLSRSSAGVVLGWETAGQVFYSVLEPASGALSAPTSAPGEGGKRRHPAVAANARGETLLVWSEGTGWNRGGSLAWQLFDRERRPAGEKGEAPALPVWDLAAAAALPDGRFVIVY